MAAKTNPKIISKAADNALAGALIVLYGIGGIGKTTVACQAPAPVLVLDCADGAAGKGVDRWPIVTAADFKDAVVWLKAGGHGYTSVVLDGYDFLYARTARADVTPDLRQRHLKAQEALHPTLYDFLALGVVKVLVLNERKKPDDANPRRKVVVLDLAPRAAELVDNAAHVLARCELRDKATETTIRVRRVDTNEAAVPAKSRFDTLKDNDRLADLWAKLGAAKTPPPGNGKQPTGEIPGDVVIPTNPAEAVRFLNHQLGSDFFTSTPHLVNVLNKHGNGVPADGDRKGWTEAVAVALDYARGQMNAPATTSQPALVPAGN